MDRRDKSDKLHIQMFAHFKMEGFGGQLDEKVLRSDMLVRLVSYLFFYRDKEISVQELIRVLWDDDELENPAGALKNLIYRLRMILKQTWPEMEIIFTGRGAYRCSFNVPCTVDTELFEQNCHLAKSAKTEEEELDFYMYAAGLYKGDFLPKLSDQHWVIPLSTYFHSLYLSAVKEAAVLLRKARRYKEMEQVLSQALLIDGLDESLHCLLIRALLYQNKLKLAVGHYEKATKILYESLGVKPSCDLREIYEELLKQTNEEGHNVAVIQKELSEEDVNGAFFCEYGVFKKAYLLERRRILRAGISAFLILITISPKADKSGGKVYLDSANKNMEILGHILLKSLRGIDVVAKYSGTQYIVLLSDCPLRAAREVMERIKRRYEASNELSEKAKMEYRLEKIK